MASEEVISPVPLVMNCKFDDYDVYVGRNRCPRTNKVGVWGNPFEIGRDGNRTEVIKKFKEWIEGQPELMEKARQELRNKRLGCWCAPAACHGEVLWEIANSPSPALIKSVIKP